MSYTEPLGSGDIDPLARLHPPAGTPADEICACVDRPPLKLMQALGWNPIHCMRCNLEVAPETLSLSPALVDSIAAWRGVYDALDRLWLDSGAYEQWAAGQLADLQTEMRESGERILCVAGGLEYVDRRVGDFLKREARRELQRSAEVYAAELGVKVKRLSIRDQSSRWGSCTSAGSLSFSWRLILAPPFVLDYLAAHEVAHLVEMNHSARFWRVCGKVCPSMERAKKWLDTYGNDLHRYGVED